jgi:hypothetical protein
MTEINSVHTLIPCIFQIKFNNILLSTSGSKNLSRPFRFLDLKFVYNSPSYLSCFTSHNFPPTSFQHSYHVWLRAQITMFNVQYAFFFCNFQLLKSKFFSMAQWYQNPRNPARFFNVSVSRITKEKTGRKFRDACDRTILLFHVYTRIAKRNTQFSNWMIRKNFTCSCSSVT